jgi:hypothetical protein
VARASAGVRAPAPFPIEGAVHGRLKAILILPSQAICSDGDRRPNDDYGLVLWGKRRRAFSSAFGICAKHLC